MQPTLHNYSYILRLWLVDQSRPADWRASLEIPGTGKRIGFASLEQLFAYLIEEVENNADGPRTGVRKPFTSQNASSSISAEATKKERGITRRK